jgi:hypothetical protein
MFEEFELLFGSAIGNFVLGRQSFGEGGRQ